jgi:hypothetical protein
VLNSVELLLLDPKYQDGKAVVVNIKGIVNIPEGSDHWTNNSHPITFTKVWRERADDPCTDS